MDERLARLEATVATLAQELADVRAKVAHLEAGHAASSTSAVEQHESAAAELTAGMVNNWLAVAGRTLVILGGAYLLRALTDAQYMPAATGVAIGLAYGAPWLLLAARSGGRGAQLDAFCYGLATALIGFPLVWEATDRFQVLSPPQSATLLAMLTAGALVLAAVRGLQSLAWIVMLGSLVSAFCLAIITKAWAPYTVLAAAVGVATLWLGYTHQWILLRWPAAAVANLMLLIVTGRAVAEGTPRTALALQAIMAAAYFGSFAVRTLVRRRSVIPFEVVQVVALLTLGIGGAVYALRASPSAVAVFGFVMFLGGGAVYGIVFGFTRLLRDATTLAFYATLALVLTMTGLTLAVGAAPAAVAFAILGVCGALLAARHQRLLMALQATIYLIAASAASGLLASATLAVGYPQDSWIRFGLVAFVALAAGAVATAMRVRKPVEPWGVFACIPQMLLLWAMTWIGMGLAVAGAAWLAGGGAPIDPVILTTIRTGVLVIAAVVTAHAGRTELAREAGWLAYPILILTGLKIVLVDFPQGRPSTLFVALAMYGVALILAGRNNRLYFASSP